jgi:hypothetical protein
MKKFVQFLTIALSAVVFASLAGATTVNLNCSPNPNVFSYNNTTGGLQTSPETCNGIGSIANIVSISYQFNYSVDTAWNTLDVPSGGVAAWSLSTTALGTHNVNQSGTVTETTSGTGNQFGAAVDCTSDATCKAALMAGGFTVTDGINSTGAAGALASTTINKQMLVTYTVSTTATPEPASYAMIGVGLLAVGFLTRRLKA